MTRFFVAALQRVLLGVYIKCHTNSPNTQQQTAESRRSDFIFVPIGLYENIWALTEGSVSVLCVRETFCLTADNVHTLQGENERQETS